MSIKDEIELRAKVSNMDYQTAKTYVWYYQRKPELKPYEQEIFELAKKRCEKFNNQNKRIIGE